MQINFCYFLLIINNIAKVLFKYESYTYSLVYNICGKDTNLCMNVRYLTLAARQKLAVH